MTEVKQRSPARLATSLFQERFASEPALVASAPGRVNLIGEHTDYNQGPVLPVALGRRTAFAAGPAPAGEWQFVSAVEPPGWTDYLAAVVEELRAVGAAPPGARVAVASGVPVGAGLSSSAALTVAAAKALSTLTGRRLPRLQLADLAYRAEHDRIGVRCGRMDQTVAALARPGHALLFDEGRDLLRLVPFAAPFWIVETGVSHRLAGGALNQRRDQCEEALALLRAEWPELMSLASLAPTDLPRAEGRLPSELGRRVRHVITECARVYEAAAALERNDLARLGRLLVEGHESLRVDYESTIPEADAIVGWAVEAGAWGARLSGAGWGGAVLVLAPEEAGDAIVAAVADAFERRFGSRPLTWTTRAGGGVRGRYIA